MSIELCKQLPQEGGGEYDSQSQQGRYEEQWLVVFSMDHTPFPPLFSESEDRVRSAVPPGTPYASGHSTQRNTSFASTYTGRLKERNNPRAHIVTVGFRPQDGLSGIDNSTPPNQRQARRSMRYTRVRVPLWRDRVEPDPMDENLGKPIVLPNGRPFRTQPTKNRIHRVYRWTKYLTAFPASAFDPYIDAVNDSPWQGFAARKLKCITVDPEEEFFPSENNPTVLEAYWHTLFEFEYNPDGWNPSEAFAADLYEKYIYNLASVLGGGDPEHRLRRILDPFGKPVNEPWPLNERGQALDPLEIIEGTVSPHFVQYNEFDEKDFDFFDQYLFTP